MKLVRVAMVLFAVLGAILFATATYAQGVPVIVGGNSGSQSQTLSSGGPALMTGPVYTETRTDTWLFLARLQLMVALGTIPSPTSGMFVARSVRFASAGRPDVWVRRVTSW